MELSKRLYAVASLVTEGASVADIGTDHGYIPIYLRENNLSPKVLAMDVNEGPLERAAVHINGKGLQEEIQLRLSDGLKELTPGEVDTIIIAGMGGALTIKILEQSPAVTKELKAFILQPQSEIGKVRQYLNENGYTSVAEDFVEEDGKYYPIMKMIHGEEAAYTPEELRYGRLLLKQKHPVLKQYLLNEKGMKEKIKESLIGKEGEHIKKRQAELNEELMMIQHLLDQFS